MLIIEIPFLPALKCMYEETFKGPDKASSIL